MIHRRLTILSLVATAAVVLVCGSALGGKPEEAAHDGWQLSVAVDREDGLYKAGDTVSFSVLVTKDGKPVTEGEAAYEILLNGIKSYATGTVKLAAEASKVPVVTKADEPWCLMLVARYRPAAGADLVAEAGAVSGVEKLRPSAATPEDFDAFWADQKKKLAAVPMNARQTPVPPPNESMAKDIECFDVQLDCLGGAPVSAYYARPKGAKPRSCPAVIGFQGAGAHSSNLTGPSGSALRGMIAMDINAHGSPNGKPEKFYADALATGDLKDYMHRGTDHRETCYFLGMYLRLARAMEFLTSQPEWDGRILITKGSSQGGAQAIVAAALEPRVTLVNVSLPALCDLTGQAAKRTSGWPVGARTLSEAQMSALRYFDVTNFAARTRAAVVVRVGLVDRTCPAAGVLAMCNQFPGEKHIVTSPVSGHVYSPPEEYAKATKVYEAVLAAMQAKAKAAATKQESKRP